MHNRPSETDVLIVGAGPTGLTAALELVARGISVRIIDKAKERSDKSRAIAVQARSLELLQKHGIAEELTEAGRKAVRAEFIVDGSAIASIDFGDLDVGDSPYPYTLFVSQAQTERCLENRLAARGNYVERPVELLTCLDGGDGVVALLKHAGGGQESLRARYVIGCDGAHSTVRHAAGIGFIGAPYDQDFVVADLDLTWKDRAVSDALQLVLPHRGFLAIFPYKNVPACRIIASGLDLLPPGDAEPTLGQVRDIFARLSPGEATLENPRWLSRFRLHHRVAERYRRGRLFLAGDAAHIHSPVGGQGMNTGIQDAINLAWKLALVIQARAHEGLLASYEEERMPVGQKLLHFTDRLFSVAASSSPFLTAARNFLVATAAPRIGKSRRGRRRLFRFISQLGIRYPESSIVSEDIRFADGTFLRGPGKGARAPDGQLERLGGGAVSLFSRITGPGHHLLVFCGNASADWTIGTSFRQRLPSSVAELCRVHVILGQEPSEIPEDLADVYVDVRGLVHARYGLTESGLYVIRPDGYIAFRTPAVDVDGFVAYFERVLVGRRYASRAAMAARSSSETRTL